MADTPKLEWTTVEDPFDGFVVVLSIEDAAKEALGTKRNIKKWNEKLDFRKEERHKIKKVKRWIAK